jgi:propanol-preferring alcohol dehydrogenase
LAARFTGYHEDGGYAEFTKVHEAYGYRLPDEFDDPTAAPLLCGGLIGYRALNRAQTPAAGKLLLVGFGSSAHLVIQIARARGNRIFVISRNEEHRRLCLALGAEWAGEEFSHIPEKMNGVIIFAPAGELIPRALYSLDRGGVLVLAGIHMSDVPELNYERHLFYEREIRTVTANTREDGVNLMREAVSAQVRPEVTTYRLEELNQALLDLKQGRIDGTGVVVMEGH